MKMTASIAARAFGRRMRRNVAVQPAPRRAAALRWRTRKPPPNTSPMRWSSAAVAFTSSWLTHYHLHFRLGERRTDRTREFFLSRNSATMISREWHERTGPRPTSEPRGRAVLLEWLQARGDRHAAAPRREVPPRSIDALIATMPQALRPMRLMFRRAALPTREHAFAASAHRPSGRREAVAVRDDVRRVPLRWFAASRAPHGGARTFKPDLRPHPGTSQTSAFAPPMRRHTTELIWRKTQQENFVTAQTMRAAAHAGLPSTAASAASSAAASRSAPPADQTSLARVLPPDPAFADRIAEDVIRRVQRHMRIERERRGV